MLVTELEVLALRTEAGYRQWMDDGNFPPPEFLDAIDSLLQHILKRHPRIEKAEFDCPECYGNTCVLPDERRRCLACGHTFESEGE